MRKLQFFLICAFLVSLGMPWRSVAQNSLSPLHLSGAVRVNGEQIVKKSREVLHRINDQKSKVYLTMVDRRGIKKEIVAWRYWKNYNNQQGLSSKTAIIAESPPDIKRQVVLMIESSQPEESEDLYTFLPGPQQPCIGRIGPNSSEIPPRCRKTREFLEVFGELDLNFMDMGLRYLNEGSHKMIGEEIFRGIACYIVESIPNRKESIYSRELTWISKEDYTIQRIDYFDIKGKLLRHQTIDWEMFKGKEDDIFVWKRSDIENVQNGDKTVFQVTDLEINIGLTDNDFNERTLGSGRLP